MEELPVKKRVAANSRQVIVLAGIPAEFKKALEDRNIQVLVARPGENRQDTDM